MAVEIVHIKIESSGTQKTVVVFDPEWRDDPMYPMQKSLHAKIVREMFPPATLFYGLNHFTAEAISQGRISQLVDISDLALLNPILFIVDLNLLAVSTHGVPAIKMIQNIRKDKRLALVETVIFSTREIGWQARVKLLRMGIGTERIFSWTSLIQAHNFRQKAEWLMKR